MLIRVGYDIEFWLPAPVSMVAMLQVHPSRVADLREPEDMRADPPPLRQSTFLDGFGNRCCRLAAEAGSLRLSGRTLVEDSGEPQAENADAWEHPVDELPDEVLPFLLSSRYCEVDRLSGLTVERFGGMARGWERVAAVCDWVHERVEFGYAFADPRKTAVETLAEGKGVCRDFQHLAIALCRGLHIPARYVAGYLGDIGVPREATPMDFSAWMEVYLGGRWWVFDARHRRPRIGRIPIAIGRDATDVAITTTFGRAELRGFRVVTEEETEVL